MGTVARPNNHSAKKALTIESKKKEARNASIGDLSNDPYFVKKAESAKKLLEKYGIIKNKK